MYGYECPCGQRIEDEDEQTLTEAAWAHAHTCGHETHVQARANDKTYGHPKHFVWGSQ